MGKVRTKDIGHVDVTPAIEDPKLFGIEHIVESVAKQFEVDLRTLLGDSIRDSDVHDFTRDLLTGQIKFELQQDSPITNEELRTTGIKILKAINDISSRMHNGKCLDFNLLEDLYNKGLLPLANIISSKAIADEIAKLTNIDPAEVFEATFTLQELDAEHRQLELVEIYEAFQLEKQQRAIPTQTLKARNTPTVQLTVQTNTPVAQPSDGERLEAERQRLLQKISKLKDDISVIRFDNAILCHEFYVGLGFMDQGVMDRIIHTLNNPDAQKYSFTNGSIWHSVGALRMATGSMTGQGLAMMFIARSADIDNECGLAQKTCDILLNTDFETTEASVADLKNAAKGIERLRNTLEDLHRGSINGCFRIDQLPQTDKGTAPTWKQLITNPLISGSFGDNQLFNPVDEETLRDLSLVYHLPLDLTSTVLNGNFPGIESNIDQHAIDASISSINGADFLKIGTDLASKTDKAKMVSHMIRSGYGTVGSSYVRGEEIVARIDSNRTQIITSMVLTGEFANRYEGLNLKAKSDLVGQLRTLDRWDEISKPALTR
ncbi:MAG: hypothetical protein U0R17_04395 [Acidimicrobiia bacterium]